jgi:hypothetical protein
MATAWRASSGRVVTDLDRAGSIYLAPATMVAFEQFVLAAAEGALERPPRRL